MKVLVEVVPSDDLVVVDTKDVVVPIKGQIIVRDSEGKMDYGKVKKLDVEGEVKMQFMRLVDSLEDKRKINDAKSEGDVMRKTFMVKARKFNMKMSIVLIRFSFDKRQMTILYVAENRVDFRDFVKELTKEYKALIRMKQIGPRDKAAIIGGLGRCGRELCCKTFLTGFPPITMDMARIQQLLGRGEAYITGACGKLKCCLKYEVSLYQKLANGLPDIGNKYIVNGIEGVVIAINVLARSVKVKTKSKSGTFDFHDIFIKEGEKKVATTSNGR